MKLEVDILGMTIQEKVLKDIKDAMRGGNAHLVTTLRMLQAAIYNKEIAKRPSKLTENDVMQVLMMEVKKRREAAEAFKKGGRAELTEKEQMEAAILQKYLPEQLPDEALKKIVTEAIKATDAKSIKELGKVMAAVMPKVKGRADGQRVSAAVKEVLGN